MEVSVTFLDREDAADQLAAMLASCELKDPLVLAIPCGGVVTGAVLARRLGAEFDVVLSRKLRAPNESELGIGAVSESGELYLNDIDDESASIPDEYIHREKEHQLSVIASRRISVRRVKPKAALAGRSVIVTDDGVATGSTMMAALQTVRSQDPAELIVAVPVAPADRIKTLEQHCDRVVCLLAAKNFLAVGQFYKRFPAIDDEQVIQVLKDFRAQAV